MLRILATFRKEYLILKRDKAGLMLLFGMPLVLIIVMALIQDAPFRDYQELKFDVLTVDNDHRTLSESIKKGLTESGQFRLIESYEGKPLTDAAARELIRRGVFKIGILIPAGVTAELINNANRIARDITHKMGSQSLIPVRKSRDSLHLVIYFDPAAKTAFKSAIHNALEKYITQVESQMILSRISIAINSQTSDTTAIDLKGVNAIGLKEESTDTRKGTEIITNSVQHNVPAWTIFAMFFIVIPMAGNMIREKDEGSQLRLRLIPGAFTDLLLGKIFFFMLVCVVQFYLMMLVGFYVLPLFGLPALHAGNNPAGVLLIAICISLAATGYGVMVGTLFNTPSQAMPFGALSIVLLSAVGGIWIPIEVMPEALQRFASTTPLNWGLTAINDLFLRRGTFADVLPEAAKLVIFCGLTLLISGWAGKRAG